MAAPKKEEKVFVERTGLYLGRFQPFHLGHMEAIKQALKQVDFLVIVLGSAQESHTKENPFTDAEREEMITTSLFYNGIRNFSVIPVDDINDDDLYVKHVEKHVPEFQIVFAADNQKTAHLFAQKNYKVTAFPRFKNISSSQIRKHIVTDDDAWKAMVPPQVVEVIEDIGGVKRVKQIHELV